MPTADPTYTCQSCGSTEVVLWAVRRVYVTVADWDTAENEQLDPEVERWCFACLASYPHEPVGDR